MKLNEYQRGGVVGGNRLVGGSRLVGGNRLVGGKTVGGKMFREAF